MSENIKRITFCAEEEDVRIIEQRQQAFGGASVSAVIRMALRKLDETPAIETRQRPAAPVEQRHTETAQRLVAACKPVIIPRPQED